MPDDLDFLAVLLEIDVLDEKEAALHQLESNPSLCLCGSYCPISLGLSSFSRHRKGWISETESIRVFANGLGMLVAIQDNAQA